MKIDIAASLKSQLDAVASSMAHYVQNAELYNSVAKAFESFDVGHTSVSSSLFYISLIGTADDLEAACKILRDLGLTPDKKEKGEAPTASWYNWFKGVPDNGPCVYLDFHSRVCRRVQVGTRMVEKPVYEIQCDNEDAEVAA